MRTLVLNGDVSFQYDAISSSPPPPLFLKDEFFGQFQVYKTEKIQRYSLYPHMHILPNYQHNSPDWYTLFKG